jgi:hypothetical protein
MNGSSLTDFGEERFGIECLFWFDTRTILIAIAISVSRLMAGDHVLLTFPELDDLDFTVAARLALERALVMILLVRLNAREPHPRAAFGAIGALD